MAKEDYERGLAERRRALGDEYVDAALSGMTDFTREFQESIVTEYAWGACWAREGLDPRTRSLITVSMLAAMGRQQELAIHVRVALRNGCTEEELREAMFQVAVYAGVPAALTGFRIAAPIVQDGA